MDELIPLDPRARLLFYLQAFTRLFLFWVPASIGLAASITFLTSSLLSGVIAAGCWCFQNSPVHP